MSLTGELVLAEDVEIFPIDDVNVENVDAIPHDPGDFVVSRAHGRQTSRVVDPLSRELLLEFAAPTRIVDAVIRFAHRRGHDPHATLDDAYPMLDGLYRAGILVSPETRERDRAEPRLTVGTTLFGWSLAACVHELEDTQVFFARNEDERVAAVKVVRGGVERIEQEASAMRRAGSRAPAIYGAHEWSGRGVLIAEWIYGDEVTTAATASRGHRGPRTEAGLLALCCEVTDAFAELHRAGVLHGDIHPRNVLVEANGRVRVIDLGLATSVGVGSARRGGVAFYLEPELAAAALRGESVPLTEAGEQYSVAVLLYQLWTGLHVLDFTLERSAMLAQIAEAPPVPFARRHVPEWPELEAVLRRALSKVPEARFPSCTELGRALRSLLPEARLRDERATKTSPIGDGSGRDATRAFLERCGIGGAVLRDKPADPPFASVNHGAAGIAYAMYKLAVARDDAHLLATADVWVQKALVLADHEKGLHAPEVDIVEKTVGAVSLFHSRSGLHGVRALVALALGEGAAAGGAIADFVVASRMPCEFLDVTLGKAGLLVGCAALLEAAYGAADCEVAAIVVRGNELKGDIEHALSGEPIATTTFLDNLGFAHGWAGVLFALLRWSQARGQSAEGYRARLGELAALREPHGTSLRWPIYNRTLAHPSYMEGWCNGSAGHALLWALAYEVLGDPEYAVLAERAASSAWSSEIRLGTICCGLAGIGYACAAAHRVTGDAVWLSRAREAARLACRDRSKWFFRDSLYKGAVGAVLLREELDGSCAATPLVESHARLTTAAPPPAPAR